MKPKCVLLIDGNWLLMSRATTMMPKFSKDLPPQDILLSKQILKDFIAQSIYRMLNQWDGIIDDIVLVGDGGSWRKSVERPEVFSDYKYKGTRERDESIDFETIFNSLTEIIDNMSSQGYTAAKVSGIEGDDWIAAYSKFFLNNHISSIIWSTDHDLQQLVAVRDDAFVCWTDGTKNCALPKEFCDRDDLMDFMLNFDARPALLSAISDKFHELGMTVSYINGHDIILEKVICGDKSDNIQSVLLTIKNGKKCGISKKEFEGIIEQTGIHTVFDIYEKQDEFIDAVRNIKRLVGSNFTDADIMDCVDYNRRMVMLSPEMIPIILKKELDHHVNEYIFKGVVEIKNNYKILTGDDENQTNIINDLISAIL